MVDVDKIVNESTEETLRRFLRKSGDSVEALTAAAQYKFVDELSKAINTTGSTLFKASTTLRESTDESIKILKTSIDNSRKSNEKTSNSLDGGYRFRDISSGVLCHYAYT